MERAVDELVGHHKIGGLVLFLQRPNGRSRKNSLDAELLHRINVGAKIQLRRQNAVSAPMPRQKRNLSAFQHAQDKRVRRLAKRRFHALFMHIRESGHRVKSAAPDNANLRLSQFPFLFRCNVYSIFELSVNTTSGAPSFVRSLRKGWETTDIHRNCKHPGRELSKYGSARSWAGLHRVCGSNSLSIPVSSSLRFVTNGLGCSACFDGFNPRSSHASSVPDLRYNSAQAEVPS